LYAKLLVKQGQLQASLQAFDVYWANTYFFGLGLKKDAPDLLAALIDLAPQREGQRWMKVFGLGDFLMVAYATPYRVIEKGVHRAVLEGARLFQDTANGVLASPFNGLSRMQLLYFLQLIIRDNYGYEFLAKALEHTATELIDEREDVQTRAYAAFLTSVAYIDAKPGESFDWLLEEFKGDLPLDLRLAVGHEGEALKARSKYIKRLRRNLDAAFKDRSFHEQVKKLYDQPIVVQVQVGDSKSPIADN
jgi:hypothetical protein